MTRRDASKTLSNQPWIWLGMIVVLATFGGGGIWAAKTEISGAVIAQGVIGVQSKIKTLQHIDGGIVREIFVQNGSRVKKGETLLRLDDTTLKANMAIVSGRIYDLEAARARLLAERDNREKIDFPAILSDKSEDPIIAEIIAGQTAQFDARRSGQLGQVQVLKNRIAQFEEQIRGGEGQKAALKTQVDIISEEIKSMTPLLEKGLVRKPRILALQREEARLRGESEKMIATIAGKREAIEGVRHQILQLDKDFRKSLARELVQTQSKIAEQRERRAAIEERLRRIDIKAPQSGTVHALSIHTVGGVISPAKPILRIIPERDLIIVEARIKPTDVDQVKIGQAASVNLTAFDSDKVPTLPAVVRKVSAAGFSDQSTGAPFFSVEIELTKDGRESLGSTVTLLPGMPAEVYIRTRARTPLRMLLKPFNEAIGRAFRS